MEVILNSSHKAMAERSVLCWLATADESGQPNVSPKEVFAVADDKHIVVANIASPGSAKNIHINAKVCLSFIDVFAQKGFKVFGVASDVTPEAAEYFRWVEPLRMMAGDRFPIHSVFVVRATAVEPIIAPSYRLYPSETTEASQVQAALRTYGVREVGGNV
ncbi:pyridoxamine 5'-phosphate oxidase family protein [Candidatus Accumulibacter necessarius]|uniref:pyridoxamine 5'-phosphate oxidase family protein n=1 Tax=Candidatus Accumulibacter necessarius TaxID=2954386 RepID=UPI003DA88365